MELTFKKLLSRYEVVNVSVFNASIISGISRFFDSMKENYSGTIPKNINRMKKSVMKVITGYSGQALSVLKKVFTSVRWRNSTGPSY